MRFEFATATKIVFGCGCVKDAAAAASAFGRRAFVVTRDSGERSIEFIRSLETQGISTITDVISAEPTIPEVIEGLRRAQADRCDIVLAFGGGSVIDTGKAVAALLTNEGNPMDYLEVVGRALPLRNRAAPFIAIPTTAGTGSEVTRNAVLAAPEQRVKASLRSPLMLPRLALVDPELTLSVPPDVTASTGLDALTQLIEPYVSSQANPLTDALCREGIRRAAAALPRAFRNGSDIEARQDMALASLFGGLALANAGLGAVHGLAAPTGGMFRAPHGSVCARLLPFVCELNVRALASRAPDSTVLERFDEVASLLTGDPSAIAHEGVAWLHRLTEALQVAPLSRFGVGAADIASIVEQSRKASSMKANPVRLSDDELAEILARAIQPGFS